MDRDAGVMRHVDRRQRRAPIDAGEPAGIAMGEDVERLRPFFFAAASLQNLEAVLADGAAHLDILVRDLRGLRPGDRGALLARMVAQHVAHALQRPAQIDRGRPRLGEHVVRAVERLVRRILAHRERDAVSRRRADQRRAAHDHRLDRVRRIFHRREFERLERDAAASSGR